MSNGIRFCRPEGEGKWGVYTGGRQPWYRKGTITAEDGRFRARFRDCDPGDQGLFDTLQLAAEAMVEAGKDEGQAIREQVAMEDANGWTHD